MLSKKLWVMLALAASLCACLQKEEPASIEADIVMFVVPDSVQLAPKFSPVKVGTQFVNVFVHNVNANAIQLSPKIEVSEGATVTPASGEMVTFTRNEKNDTTNFVAWYTVVSENGKNTNAYKITLIPPHSEYLFSFDRWDTISNGRVNYVTPSDRQWATGNPAVAIYLGTKNDPATYPATFTANATSGLAAKMQTVAGAPQFGAPIAAGNLFWGIFNSGNLLGDKLTFTQFGQPFYQKPKMLKGFYQYKAGNRFTDTNNEEVVGRKDSCSIYAILYETDEQDFTLDGRNVQTSERIAAKAIMNSGDTPGEDYVPFEIPFVYDREPDFANKPYKLTVVFTSSKSGGTFEGAVGSVLLVDEVTLECYEE